MVQQTQPAKGVCCGKSTNSAVIELGLRFWRVELGELLRQEMNLTCAWLVMVTIHGFVRMRSHQSEPRSLSPEPISRRLECCSTTALLIARCHIYCVSPPLRHCPEAPGAIRSIGPPSDRATKKGIILYVQIISTEPVPDHVNLDGTLRLTLRLICGLQIQFSLATVHRSCSVTAVLLPSITATAKAPGNGLFSPSFPLTSRNWLIKQKTLVPGGNARRPGKNGLMSPKRRCISLHIGRSQRLTDVECPIQARELASRSIRDEYAPRRHWRLDHVRYVYVHIDYGPVCVCTYRLSGPGTYEHRDEKALSSGLSS